MDSWTEEYEKTEYPYKQTQSKYAALRKTNLTPGFLIRYADDFVILTDTRAHAESWKMRLEEFLKNRMKLTLSTEKTLITNVGKKYIKFPGYKLKPVPGKGQKGYVTRTLPDDDRLKRKVNEIAGGIKKIPRNYSKEKLIAEINRINSKIRGLVPYYPCCTWVNISMQKYHHWLQRVAKRRLKQCGGKWIPAKDTQNLPRVHEQYKAKIPAVKYRDIYVGFTALTFCKWEKVPQKNQAETPYSEEGRERNFKQTKKKRILARLAEHAQ